MKKIILLIFTITLFVSCKVTFVPTQSPAALSLLSQIQTDANVIWTSTNLAFNSAAYLNVDNEIASLITLDKSRVKSGTILNQDLRIQKIFSEYESEHSIKGTIVESQANTYNVYFKSIVDPRIVSENSLKP
jgi:hypothetical protein